jgi:phosphoribulokinase
MENSKKLIYYLYTNGESIIGVDIEGSVHRNEAAIVSGSIRKNFTEQNDILFYGIPADERITLEEVFKTYIGFETQGLHREEMPGAMMNHYTSQGRAKVKQEI